MQQPAQRQGWRRILSLAVRTGVGLVCLIVAVAVYQVLVATRDDPQANPLPERVLNVNVVEVSPVEVERVWIGHGAARAMDEADLSAQVAARVTERSARIEPGQPVRRGDVIVELDRSDELSRVTAAEQRVAATQAELQRLVTDEQSLAEQVELARLEVDWARTDLQRERDALERGATTQAIIDARQIALTRTQRTLLALEQQLDGLPSERLRLEARLDGERADLSLARQNLSRTTITAPIDGVLQAVYAEPGELLGVGSPVARIVDVSRLEIPLRLPASATGSVAVGDRVVLRPDGPDSSEWAGRIARIAPEVDASTRTVTAFAEVTQDPDAERALRPGRFLVGRVLAAPRQALLIPRHVIDRDRVFVLGPERGEGHEVRDVPVRVEHHLDRAMPELHPHETQWAVIAEGLQAGARVVVTNQAEIRDGSVVRARVATDPPPSVESPAGGSAEPSASAAGGVRP